MNQRLCYLTTNTNGELSVRNPSAATAGQIQAMLSCKAPLQGETPRRTTLRHVCYLTSQIDPKNKQWVTSFFQGLLGR